MYQLKSEVDLKDLFACVRKCNSDVYFKTKDGDNLNLKSELSHYVIMIVANNKDFLLKGHIECVDETDYSLLTDYIIYNE